MFGKKLFLGVCLFFFIFSTIFAVQKAEAEQLKLIPTPQRVILLNNSFKIQKNTPILLANPHDPNDVFTAQQLVEEIQNQFGYKPEIKKFGFFSPRHAIVIGRLGRDKKINKAVENLKISLDPHLESDSYILSITPNQILVAGKDSAGTFYGIQTLKQIIRANRTDNTIPCCLIQDWPAFKFRAWLEDVTRGPIPKIEILKRKIRTMAEYKENMLTMYTEHVFKLIKHPIISPDGALTADEIKELSAYAQKYHVDLVGNFQSLAHFWNILKHPEYAHLKETTDIITPAKEESYEFLKEVYSEIVPAYSSKYFHACGDEAGAIGQGPAKQMAKEMGRGGLYVYHFNRVNEMLKPYGKTMMLWCDMMGHYPEDLKKFPKDIILIPWTYSTWKVDNYERLIKPVIESGHRFMVCSGIMNWGRMWPDFEPAIMNNAMWTRDCFKYKGLGIFNTSWLDSGEELYDYNWYPFIWGAECAWKPVLSENEKSYDALVKQRVALFDQAFDPLFYGSKNDVMIKALLELDSLRKYSTSRDKGVWYTLSNAVFWNDPFNNLDYTIDDDSDKDPAEMLSHANKVINLLQQAKKVTAYNSDTIDYAVFAAQRIAFVAQRRLLHNDVVRYKRDGKGSVEKIQKNFSLLADELKSLKKEYIRLWHQENRGDWLDVILAKYDYLLDSIKTKDISIEIPKIDIFTDLTTVELKTFLGIGDIYFTRDGSEPNKLSIRYMSPLVLDDTTLVKARTYYKDRCSPVYQKQFKKMDSNDCIFYSYYQSQIPRLWEKLPDFDLLTPVKTGDTKSFDINLRDQDDFFAFSFSGFINIDTEGEYTFYIKSDDGGRLFIDGKELIENDGLHGSVEKSGKILLRPGQHVITVHQFDCLGYEDLAVSYEGPGIKKQTVKCSK